MDPPSPMKPRKTQYRIETKSISYCAPNAPTRYPAILKNVTCNAPSGQLVAIVGPSGAGKTTLLSILAGAIHPCNISGAILVNGSPMEVSRFRRISGHVTQDDALFPLLTPEESLLYSARLRLKATKSEAVIRVSELIAELGLSHVAGSTITGTNGGISGGEKRRVSIGVDMVHDPAVLLLDEPTSGLDSVSALQIVKMLKSMASAHGKTIVLTIHQPGYRILELIDQIILICDGMVRHQGSIKSMEARMVELGHVIPTHVNVLEFAMDKMSGSKILELEQNVGRQHEAQVSKHVKVDHDRVLYANSHVSEILILAERFFKNVLRTRQLFMARMVQSVLAGIGLGTIFISVTNIQARLGFFAFSLTFLLSLTTEGLPVYLQEKRILQRETSRGAYRVSSYVIANALVFLPFLLAGALLYTVPVYWLVGLRTEIDRFLYFSLVVWMVMLMANSFVACFSAIVPNFIMGNSVIAGLMGSFFLFSGYFISKDNIPKYWIFMHYLSLFKYPFEAFLLNEYGGEKGRKECLEMETSGCAVTGGMFVQQYGLKEAQRWSNIWVMLGFIVGYRVLCFLFLWFKCKKMRR
jgi:ABC-type multidrug transport system ATPase subunit